MAAPGTSRKLQTFLPSLFSWRSQMLAFCNLYSAKRTTVGGIVLFGCVLLLNGTVFLVTLLGRPLHTASGSYLFDNGVPMILLIATVGCVVKVSHMLTQRARVAQISSALLYFDSTIQRLDFRMRCEEVNYWTTGWVVTFFAATISLTVATGMFGSKVFNTLHTAVLMTFIDISNIPYIVLLIWFMIFELCIWCRLKLLCASVENGMHLAKATARKDTVLLRQLVAGVADLHSVLSSVAEHVNSLFVMQVFMCIAAYTSLLIFTLFSYYRAAVVMGDMEYNFAWMTISWSLYNGLFVLPSILYGAWVRMEADRFAKTIHRLLRRTTDVLAQEQLSVLSQQLHHRRIGTRACFTPINWPVYASIVGYISTYVVILIQFDSKAMEIMKSNNPALTP